MPGMSRGGGMMPGQGGNTMAGDMIGSMFGAAPQRAAPWNNWGMGDAPDGMTPAMFGLQKRCLAGDGRACNELQIAQAQQQQATSKFYDTANKRGQWFTSGIGSSGGPMRAR